MELTNFEKKIITAIAEADSQSDLILEQLATASVISRDYTGIGLFTKFSVLPTTCMLDESRWKIENLPKCHANHPSLLVGAGFILWLEGGYIKCLEGYTYEGDWPADENLFEPVTD